MDDPNYAALLNVFSVNLTHSTGSRAVKRFVDGSSKTLVYHLVKQELFLKIIFYSNLVCWLILWEE